VRFRLALILIVGVGLGGCAKPPPSLGDPHLDSGRDVFRRVCATCHGGNGEGAAGPALANVVATFPLCADHQHWVTLGTARWKEEVGPTYGSANTEVTKIMPSFEETLTSEQIAEVAAFERFSFGGATADEALSSCGLAS
jgi:mono/diheme cytochrome c family protein